MYGPVGWIGVRVIIHESGKEKGGKDERRGRGGLAGRKRRYEWEAPALGGDSIDPRKSRSAQREGNRRRRRENGGAEGEFEA